MLNKISSIAAATVVAMSFVIAGEAQAADLDFTGTFNNDNDVLFFEFTLDSARQTTIFSSSWDNGGFDPILALWDANGNLMQQQDDGLLTGSQVSNGISYDYGSWDTYFTRYLTAGTYTASVAQYASFAVSSYLADGFRYDGAGNENFTAGYGCSNGSFCGVGNSNRTNNWTFHLLNVDSATVTHQNVPEPITGLVLAAGMGGAALRRAKKAKKS